VAAGGHTRGTSRRRTSRRPHKSGRPRGSHADSAGSAWESPLRSAENRQMAGQRTNRSPGSLLTRECWMVCHYSRRPPVSSDKHGTPSDTEAEEQDASTSDVGSAMLVMGSCRPLSEPPKVMSRAAKAAKALISRTRGRLYV
jgi:hypothetical protein